GERVRERGQIGERQRIDAQGVARTRQLQQAQLRAIGALPQEFGVQREALERSELCSQLRQLRGCRDDRMQRVQGGSVQSGTSHYASPGPRTIVMAQLPMGLPAKATGSGPP